MARVFEDDKSTIILFIMCKRILFIGGGYPSHFFRLASHLFDYDKSISIDWLTSSHVPEDVRKASSYPISRLFEIKRLFPSFLYRIPILSSICAVLDLRRSINNYKLSGYSIVSIQYVDSLYAFNLNQIKKTGLKLVLSPWGSDVHKASRLDKLLLKSVYKKADFVTILTEDFGKDIIKPYKVPKDKCVYLDYGSDPLDTIIDNLEKVSKRDAKIQLGIDPESTTIVCGTNSAVSQRHCQIIDSLISVRNQLPVNITLMVMLGRSKDYDKEVIDKLKKSNINYLCFERRLSEWEMFLWRRASDYLIHGQVSDSNSVSIQEAMLCDTTIINGQWLRYPHHEKFGTPYFLFNSFSDLGSVVIRAIGGEKTALISDELKTEIKKMAWSNMIKQWDEFFNSIAGF